MKEIRGIITAMVTPFSDDGAVDEAAARGLARHLLENGSHGLVVSGTSGESPTLADQAKIALWRAVRDEIGADVPLDRRQRLQRHPAHGRADRCGGRGGRGRGAGVTPYYNKPNGRPWRPLRGGERGRRPPILLYNIPSRCVLNLPGAAGGAGAASNVVGVEQANDAELGPIERLDVLAGNDGVFGRTIEFGGAGGILVSSTSSARRCGRCGTPDRRGDLDRAREIDAELRPSRGDHGHRQSDPVKAALEMLGVLERALRLPMIAADAEQRAQSPRARGRRIARAAAP